jgi:hypothetical protein
MVEVKNFVDSLNNEYRKKCIRCKEFKQSENFYKRATEPDGLTNECKACLKDRRELKKKDREQYREYFTI